MEHIDSTANSGNPADSTQSNNPNQSACAPSASSTQSQSPDHPTDAASAAVTNDTDPLVLSTQPTESSSTDADTAVPMEIDEPAAAAIATTDGIAAITSDTVFLAQSLDDEEQRIQEYLKLIHTDGKKGDASVRAILKLLQSLERAPTKIENRRLRRDNIIIKKQIMEVNGAKLLMELIGFREITVNNLPYLMIDDSAGVQHSYLCKALRLLAQYQERAVEDAKKTPAQSSSSAPLQRPQCAGGCGFYGDPHTENMCSLCYKRKYLGAAAVKAMTGVDVNEPKKCVKGCGLFGADKFGGLCSQCHQKQQVAAAATMKVLAKMTPKQRFRSLRLKFHAIHLFLSGRQAPQPNKNRCFTCSKRLPVPIECRCRRTFCSDHRFPLDHQCSYDQRSEHKKNLKKNLIQLETKKIDRI